MKPVLLTTRFDDKTWAENAQYRGQYCIKAQQCMYAAPKEITTAVELDAKCYVLELNNTKNQLEGIGFIVNRPNYGRNIYAVSDYNRCYYLGHYHVDRALIQRWLPELLALVDKALFCNRKHLKRGLGITLVSQAWLDMQGLPHLLEEIRALFRWLFEP